MKFGLRDRARKVKVKSRRQTHLLYLLLVWVCLAWLWIFLTQEKKEDFRTPDEVSNSKPGPNMEGLDLHTYQGVDVALVFTVHGALDYFQQALDTLEQSIAFWEGRMHVYVADDCDDRRESTKIKSMLGGFPLPSHVVSAGLQNRGYTHAVNAGLRRAIADSFEVMVVLNSDLVFGPMWLEPLIAALVSNKSIGIAGPLGNAASYQSVPLLADSTGKWSLNPLPAGWTPNLMVALARLVSNQELISVPMLNGFVMAIHRRVLDTIGFMNDELFPTGYGEENDFAFRATRAGFRLVIQPSSYVYHHKTKSFTKEERNVHNQKGQQMLKLTWGKQLQEAVMVMSACPFLQRTRKNFAQHLDSMLPLVKRKFSVLFLLNVMARPKPFLLRDGWTSIVHEALGLGMSGAFVRLAVQKWTVPFFVEAFPGAPQELFVGFNAITSRDVAREILQQHMVYNFVVATHHSTVETIHTISARYPSSIRTYYIQDMAIKFDETSSQEVSPYRQLAGGLIFVKTRRLQEELRSRYGLDASLITPSIDAGIFLAPSLNLLQTKQPKTKLSVCAPVQRESSSQQHRQTLKVLIHAVTTIGPSRLDVAIFGSSFSDLQQMVGELTGDSAMLRYFQIEEIVDHVRRARLYRSCDVLLDFSSLQVSSRSKLEAMASGCIPIFPLSESSGDYGEHGKDVVLLNSSNIQDGTNALLEFFGGKYNLDIMRQNAIATAKMYDIQRKGAASAHVFHNFLSRQIKGHVTNHQLLIQDCSSS